MYVLYTYVRTLMIAHANSTCQNFHCAKKLQKFFANGIHWQKFSPGENFRVYGICLHACNVFILQLTFQKTD